MTMIPLIIFVLIISTSIIICSSKEINHKQQYENNNKSDMKFPAKRSNNDNKNNHNHNSMRGESTLGIETVKCRIGQCAECICPIDLIESCIKSFYKDILFCKSTKCFCAINSTSGVGYYGPGSSNCKNSLLCCKDCNPSSS